MPFVYATIQYLGGAKCACIFATRVHGNAEKSQFKGVAKMHTGVRGGVPPFAQVQLKELVRRLFSIALGDERRQARAAQMSIFQHFGRSHGIQGVGTVKEH